ncbi:hypothetical protein PFISCL1PPCAC_17512, partial [Pristionchus fissidentatus]
SLQNCVTLSRRQMSFGFKRKPAIRPEHRQELDKWEALMRQAAQPEQRKLDDATDSYIQQERQRKAEEAEREKKRQVDTESTPTSTEYNGHASGSTDHNAQDNADSEGVSASKLDSSITLTNNTPADRLAPTPNHQSSDDAEEQKWAALTSAAAAAAPSVFRGTQQQREEEEVDELSRKFAALTPPAATNSAPAAPTSKSVRFNLPAEESESEETNNGHTSAASANRGFGAKWRAAEAAPEPEPSHRPTTAFPSSFRFASSSTASKQQTTTVPPPAEPDATQTESRNGFGYKTSFGGGNSATVALRASGVALVNPFAGIKSGFGGGSSATAPQASTVLADRPSPFASAQLRNESSGFGSKTGFGGTNSTTLSNNPSPFASMVPRDPSSSGFGTKTGFGGTISTTVSHDPSPFSSMQPKNTSSGFGSKTGFGGGSLNTVPTVSTPSSDTVSGDSSSGFGSKSGFGGSMNNSATVSQATTVSFTPPSEIESYGFGTKTGFGCGFGSNSTTVSQSSTESTSASSQSSGFNGFKSTATAFVPNGSCGSRLLQNAVEKSVRSTAAAAAVAAAGFRSSSAAASPPSREQQEEKKMEQVEVNGVNEAAARTGPFPWGNRPCFREMLDGGKNKLVLTDPPASINNYFSGQVSQSYGCTYDDLTATFFATAPGSKGRDCGWITAMSGDSSVDPVRVAQDLPSPAAIGIYQPGLSVCVVTDRGIFVLERKISPNGDLQSFYSRQVTRRGGHRGISATAGGGIVSVNRGLIRIFDGAVESGAERVMAETNYDMAIRNSGVITHRLGTPNVSFLDVCGNKLAISDLGWHCISLWQIDETPAGTSINFLRAIDVGSDALMVDKRTRAPVRPGKCSFAAGIRLDREGWVICADAAGRTIQIWDDKLQFVCRVEPPPSGLPYISGLYVESDCHLMVCDRRDEFGGLRCYILEAKDVNEPAATKPAARRKFAAPSAFAAAAPTSGFAAAARLQLQQRNF